MKNSFSLKYQHFCSCRDKRTIHADQTN